jgi:hypothetical protein
MVAGTASYCLTVACSAANPVELAEADPDGEEALLAGLPALLPALLLQAAAISTAGTTPAAKPQVLADLERYLIG